MVYTVTETAKLLKLNPETVRRMLRDGRLKGFKVGEVWRISEEEIKRIKGEN